MQKEPGEPEYRYQLKPRKKCNCKGRPIKVNGSGKTFIKGRVTSMNQSSNISRQPDRIKKNSLKESYDSIQETRVVQPKINSVKEEQPILVAQAIEKDFNPLNIGKNQVPNKENRFFKKIMSWLKQLIH